MTENIQDYNNLEERLEAFEIKPEDENLFCIWVISEILKKHGEFNNYIEEVERIFEVITRYQKIEPSELNTLLYSSHIFEEDNLLYSSHIFEEDNQD